ncbi:hypothetical protein [Tsukamurella ocularis]|uniref:hypothetical protein n=1 Tax=Tsukamurella ocularis TaxID=1970234 RepID=UPI002167D14A|nr:hypothetical protein [Tsukamurella ocularis]MCS3780167.1 hypothetical protein [Tsukamurella ocularis]MCS3786279.1 hypothetical protein [Tsukamurella ocularis]MCS3849643.1 hypothetical protein [Tsukamurella ocularis]
MAVLAAVGLPGIAHAAPVNTAQAVLAAHEFPAGTTGYEVETETLTSIGARATPGAVDDPSPSACSRNISRMFERMEGARVTEARAVRGSTRVEAVVLNRPMTALMTETFPTCEATLLPSERSAVLAAPRDLARLRPFIFRDKDELQAWVDVRGVAINVTARGTNRSPADADAFWQTLHAQVAKVERQP